MQHEGDGRHQDAKLVAEERCAACAIDIEILQLLDSVSGITTLAVGFVGRLGRGAQIPNDEAHVALRLAVGMRNDLRLDDYSPLIFYDPAL